MVQRVVEESRDLVAALEVLGLPIVFHVADGSLAVASIEYEYSGEPRLKFEIYGEGKTAAVELKQWLVNLLDAHRKLVDFRQKARQGEISVEYVYAAYETLENVKNKILRMDAYARRYAKALGIYEPDRSKTIGEKLEELIEDIAEDVAYNICSCPEG